MGTDRLTNNYIDQVIRTDLQPDRGELYRLFNRTEAMTQNETQKSLHFRFLKISPCTRLTQSQSRTSQPTIKALKKSQLLHMPQSIIQFYDD